MVESVRPHTKKSRFSNVPVPADGAGASPIAGSAFFRRSHEDFPGAPHVPGVTAALCAAGNYALRDVKTAEGAVIFYRGANRTNGIGAVLQSKENRSR